MLYFVDTARRDVSGGGHDITTRLALSCSTTFLQVHTKTLVIFCSRPFCHPRSRTVSYSVQRPDSTIYNDDTTSNHQLTRSRQGNDTAVVRTIYLATMQCCVDDSLALSPGKTPAVHRPHRRCNFRAPRMYCQIQQPSLILSFRRDPS